jgi:hypothetical protein
MEDWSTILKVELVTTDGLLLLDEAVLTDLLAAVVALMDGEGIEGDWMD